MARLAARLVLGTALIAHGLANTVLPLRGADAGPPGALMPPVTALYTIAIVGFVAAGLGVFGVRPLARLSVPLSLVAGLCALAAQFWHADGDLLPGVFLSASLPALVAFHASVRQSFAKGPPRRPGISRWGRRATTVLAFAFLGWVAASAMLWPWHRSWGAEPIEWTLSLPGDRVPRTPALEILHGITIDAPPQAVWPWLMQLGQDRGGFYSYTWLERAFGVEIANADTIHPEWQSRRVGEYVYATQEQYLGGVFGVRPGWIVDRLDPQRALVLRGWGAFVLRPQAGGRTRLLVRSTISQEQIPVWLAAINFTAFELPHFIMQRRMLIGIRERAERAARS